MVFFPNTNQKNLQWFKSEADQDSDTSACLLVERFSENLEYLRIGLWYYHTKCRTQNYINLKKTPILRPCFQYLIPKGPFNQGMEKSLQSSNHLGQEGWIVLKILGKASCLIRESTCLQHGNLLLFN